MNIENQIIRYYVQDDESLKEYLELYEIPKPEHIFLLEKRMSRDIADIFYGIGYKNKSELIKNCNSLRFLQQCVSNEDHKHWHGSFCRDRYCPICSHIKAHKESQMLEDIFASIKKDNNYKRSYVVFVTFTQKNVPVGELKNELNKINSAIKKILTTEPLFKDSTEFTIDKKTGKKKKKKRLALCQGTIRHLEITSGYSQERRRIEFHPHLHMILLVKKSYWSECNKALQWTNEKLQAMWQKHMDLDYNPNVDIRLAKNKDIYKAELKLGSRQDTDDNTNSISEGGKNHISELNPLGVIKELCKYSTKETDIIKFDQKEDGRIKINWNDTKIILKEIYISMHQKRTLILTGAFKKTKERLYGKKEAEDLVAEMTEADLIQVFRHRCKKCGSAITEHLFRYYPKSKNYKELKGEANIENYKQNVYTKVNAKALKDIEQSKKEDKLLEWLEEDYFETKKTDVSDQTTSDLIKSL